jgi:hypothetical protein
MKKVQARGLESEWEGSKWLNFRCKPTEALSPNQLKKQNQRTDFFVKMLILNKLRKKRHLF